MAATPDAGFDDFLATVAVARLVLGPGMRIQAPPNLVSRAECLALIGAGVDDWGGVAADPRPRQPRTAVARAGRVGGGDRRGRFRSGAAADRATATSRPGLAWIDPRVQAHVAVLADPDTGLRATSTGGPAVAGARRGRGVIGHRSSLGHRHRGRRTATRSDLGDAFGDWESIRDRVGELAARAPERIDTDVIAALRSAERNPGGCSDDEYLALATADGIPLDAVAAFADSLRRDTVGDDVTFVVNLQHQLHQHLLAPWLPVLCASAQRRRCRCILAVDPGGGGPGAEAHVAGATEVCMQAGSTRNCRHRLRRSGRAVKAGVPRCTHAFSPMEIANGSPGPVWAAGSGWSLRARRVDTIPGTAAEIRRRGALVLTKAAAHLAGSRSSAPRTRSACARADDDVWPRRHPAALGRAPQRAARHPGPHGGFTEFVPLPFVHQSSPLYLAGASRPGPTHRDNRAVALARIMLHGRISQIQTSWVKLGRGTHPGDAQRRRQRPRRHADGGDDLPDGRLRTHGSAKTVAELAAIAEGIGRPARQPDHHLRQAGGRASSRGGFLCDVWYQ